MCYGGPGQMQQAAAAGVPPSVARSSTEPGPDADSAGSSIASQIMPREGDPTGKYDVGGGARIDRWAFFT
jgi:hypothetical protein